MQQNDDPTAESRKRDHIELALKSQVSKGALDPRFSYEPLLAGHPPQNSWPPFEFFGKKMKAPLWVSSMTGGTEWAKTINHNLARACGEFGLGMGLGSCRSLLFSDEYLADFDVRHLLGDQPLFANLGVAQIEQLLEKNEIPAVEELIKKLRADGLIIHVNPLQEAMQPEGDRFKNAPIETIKHFLEKVDFPVVVKEVGQGMGYESLKALFQLPLAAVDFAASGGTNFALLELLRGEQQKLEAFEPLTHVGHGADEMLHLSNQIVAELSEKIRCRQLIISGGIKTFLDGYYLVEKSTLPAVYGQASGFLHHARGDYEDLKNYIATQIQGLELARAFLKVL